jgi:hypothetical protein
MDFEWAFGLGNKLLYLGLELVGITDYTQQAGDRTMLMNEGFGLIALKFAWVIRVSFEVSLL